MELLYSDQRITIFEYDIRILKLKFLKVLVILDHLENLERSFRVKIILLIKKKLLPYLHICRGGAERTKKNAVVGRKTFRFQTLLFLGFGTVKREADRVRKIQLHREKFRQVEKVIPNWASFTRPRLSKPKKLVLWKLMRASEINLPPFPDCCTFFTLMRKRRSRNSHNYHEI